MIDGITRRTFLELPLARLVRGDDDYRLERLQHEVEDLRHHTEMKMAEIGELLLLTRAKQMEIIDTGNFNALVLNGRLKTVESVLRGLLRRLPPVREPKRQA